MAGARVYKVWPSCVGRYQVLCNPACDRRTDGVAGTFSLCKAVADVRELSGVGEAVSEDGAVDVVDLDLPRGGKSGLLESEVKAADACKEATDGRFLWVLGIHVVLVRLDALRRAG